MADLEQLALKRDRGFLVRLVLLLVLGLLAGAFVYGQLIGDTATGCLARSIGSSAGVPPSSPSDNSVR